MHVAPLWSLRSRLMVLILLAMLPAFGLTLYTGMEEHRVEKAQAQENVLRLTRLAAGDLVQVIEGSRQLLIGLAQLPEVRQGASNVCAPLFSSLLKQYPHYVNLGAIGLDGSLFCSGLPAGGRSFNYADRAYFQRALEARTFTMSGYETESITGMPVVNFAYPVLSESGEVEAVVIASLDLAWFKQLEVEARLPAHAALLVMDQSGTILARYPETTRWTGRSVADEPIFRAALSQASESTLEARGMDEVLRLYGISTVRGAAGSDIYVSIGLSRSEAFGRVYWVLIRNLGGLVLVGVLALAATWIGGNIFILRPVNTLVNATKKLASGDLSVRIRPPYDQDELSLLAGSFDEMAASLEQRTNQLHQAEARYRTLVEQIPMVTYIAPLEKSNGTLYISPQVEEILGFSPGEWQADPQLWLKQIHPEDRDRVLTETHIAQGSEGEAGFRTEYRMWSRYNTLLWLRDEAVVVRNEAGQAELLQGVMLNITETKRFEEELRSSRERLRELAAHIEAVRENERTWMAREIHDELGQALTGLKMDLSWLDKKISDPDQLPPFSQLLEKISSMKKLTDATIHSVRKIATALRPGILDSLGLTAAIEWQASDFQSRIGIRCDFSSLPESMEVEERRSSAVFRIFQEILTNVARHAQATRVIISLREEAGNLVLEVSDNGKGITETEKRNAKSLGLLGMRERALLLGGDVSIEGVEGEGTTVTVRIPLGPGPEI